MNYSQEYLNIIRKVFEKRYKRLLTQEEVELFADRIVNFGTVIQNFYKRKKNMGINMKFGLKNSQNMLKRKIAEMLMNQA